MRDQRRFAGRMSEEYRLVERAYPHFEELQQAVGAAVAAHEARSGNPVQVLELGCGDGLTSDILLRAREDLHLTALDNEEQMVERAQENLGDWIRQEHLTLVRTDALTFMAGCDDGTFDVVASAMTLHNFLRIDREPVLREAFRILKPGGLFVNADKYAPGEQERFDALVKQLGRFFEAFVPMGKLELLKDWVMHNVADQGPDRVMTEEQARRDMEELGFADVRVSMRRNMEALMTARKP
jgi:ubiquinone/menaquinone biosynthesis C-methylase UbiE